MVISLSPECFKKIYNGSIRAYCHLFFTSTPYPRLHHFWYIYTSPCAFYISTRQNFPRKLLWII